MSRSSSEHRIALFLDFENLTTNTGITAASFDLQPSLDRLLEKGKVVYRRAYCDWSRFAEAKGHLHSLGVDLVDVPPSTRAGKNAADMRLVIDALELCYAREHIDVFVIASGDSDFCPLAYKLRENDKTVIGLGVRDSTSPLFVRACDEFIYLKPSQRRGGGHGRDKEREEEDKPRATKKDKGEEKPARGGKKDKEKDKEKEKEKAPAHGGEVPDAVREVVARLVSRASEPVNPSLIKETLVRRQPDFDEREHGFSTFTKLLGALEAEGLLKRVQHGRQWYVVPPDAPHEPAAPSRRAAPHAAPAQAAAHHEEEELESYPDPDEDELG